MKKIITGVIAALLIANLSFIQETFAQQAIDPTFNPGFLIPDEAFSDVGTFGSAAAVQNFLQLKGSVLANTSPDFLIKLKEPDTLTKVGLEDPQPNLGRLRTAAELIYDASTKHGLNPQVTLVILQKEQSLINGTFNSDNNLQRALDRAAGFGCPDYEGCGDIFLGFYRQLFGSFDAEGNRWLGTAASLMRSFQTEVGGVRVGRGPGVDVAGQTFGRPIIRTSRKGDTVVFDNTLGGYAGVSQQQTVTMQNLATTALYRYTPHVFNGNYNFWKFYTAWFKYPNGTVIQRVGDSAMYVIDNGTKRTFSSFVAQQRKIKTDVIIPVSQTEFDSYQTEKPMPPLDGTLIKGDVSGAVFLVQDTKKRPISYPVFIQRRFSFASVVTVPQAEIDSYDSGGFIPPQNGTLIIGETDPTVYLVDGELKRPISAEIFKARRFSFRNLMRLSDTEVIAFPLGPFVYPPDQTAIKLNGDTAIYWYKGGQKQFVSAFVYKQRTVGNFLHLTIGFDEFASIPTGYPFPPRDGTVIKGDTGSAIYRIENGVKRLFTLAAYQRARNPRPTILPQQEVDSYQEGEVIAR